MWSPLRSLKTIFPHAVTGNRKQRWLSIKSNPQSPDAAGTMLHPDE
jgi:hypothetical protein